VSNSSTQTVAERAFDCGKNERAELESWTWRAVDESNDDSVFLQNHSVNQRWLSRKKAVSAAAFAATPADWTLAISAGLTAAPVGVLRKLDV
jgi:hypothetical protein